MEPTLPQGRLVWYLEDAQPGLLLAPPGAAEAQRAQALLAAAGEAGGAARLLQIDIAALAAEGKRDSWADAAHDPQSIAYILFTSGAGAGRLRRLLLPARCACRSNGLTAATALAPLPAHAPGSTGRPKGVMVKHVGLRDLVQGTGRGLHRLGAHGWGVEQVVSAVQLQRWSQPLTTLHRTRRLSPPPLLQDTAT